MSTPSRYFQKDSFYHVYNRGNRKQNIFLQSRDYERFLKRTIEYKKEFGITILCFCLMPNHFHFLLRQDSEIPVTTFMLRLGTSYAKYFNIKYNEVGSLFQGRFKAKLIETEEYLLQLSGYIHRNPNEILPPTPGVELGSYQWSSYPIYLNGISDKLIDPSYLLNYFAKSNPVEDYKNFVESFFKEENLESIKDLILEKTSASNPWG
ncbi:hypothetical protein C4559_04130 [Candidatus Microgenomates bacterium]|nr:MAG: hypothetical protein C4559_04130 [Candidatus Microgenomates bacterium]